MRRKALWALTLVLLATAAGVTAANLRRGGQTWAFDAPAVRKSAARIAVEWPSGGVNVNTADLAELRTINGVGETLGQAILDERERNGAFGYPADLLNVKGIGEKTLQKLLGQLTLGDSAP